MKERLYKWLKNPWSYATGAVLISLIQILTLKITGHPWGVTSAFINWGAWIYESFGGNVSNWAYFQDNIAQTSYLAGFFKDPVTLRNIGIIAGAFLAALLSRQFRVKKIKSPKFIVLSALGGLLMGYGSSIAAGCNIGAFYSGISSLSISGWIFAVFMFIGGILGSKILMKFIN